MFREYALALVEAVAERYGEHPAVALWHVSNELGCHNAHCYCDVSAASFRRWLQRRYGSIAALNRAWGTSFWSQRYTDWDEIGTPRLTLSTRNPGQVLDFSRFSSDELLDYYRSELAVIRRHSAVPVTTNFMVTAHIRELDYWTWAPEVDVIANDHYLDHRLDDPASELAFAADLTRGLAGGAPWMLMEHSTGSVNWQPHNLAKAPGQMIRDSLQHVARGADSVCFFQWRASLQGSEKFHSALIPHAGTDSALWREALELGARPGPHGRGRRHPRRRRRRPALQLGGVVGRRRREPPERSRDLPRSGVGAAPGPPRVGRHRRRRAPGRRPLGLPAHRRSRACTSCATAKPRRSMPPSPRARTRSSPSTAASSTRTTACGPAGIPAVWRDLLGIRVEEFAPVLPGETVTLESGTDSVAVDRAPRRPRRRGARPLRRRTRGRAARAHPAARAGRRRRRVVSRDAARRRRASPASSTRRSPRPGAQRAAGARADVDVVRRVGDDRSYRFIINHGSDDVLLNARGLDLVTGETASGTIRVPAGAVRVIREDAAS